MNPDSISADLDRLKQRLQKKGFFLTVQRELVYRALLSSRKHPSADELWESLRKYEPKISRMSVFRTLELLVELGLARVLEHPGNAARYDGTTDPHFHLICTVCHRVIDWMAVVKPPPVPCGPPPEGFMIRDVSVIFSGLCAECSENRDYTISDGE